MFLKMQVSLFYVIKFTIGIACLQMALRWLRDTDCEAGSDLAPSEIIERKILIENAGTRSIWTVDLLILLEELLKEQEGNQHQPNHYNTTYLFSSEVLGVNESHSTTGYYALAFGKDSERVKEHFVRIRSQQLPVLCPFHMQFSQLLSLIILERCIAIVLVDNNVLRERKDSFADSDEQSVKASSSQEEDSYMGHFVIVCGISQEAKHVKESLSWETEPNTFGDSSCIVLANPGLSEQAMFVTRQRFERAWRAKGTDCDIIFIAKH